MQPAVSGDAMDVPLSMWYDPSGTGYVLTCRITAVSVMRGAFTSRRQP